jgi:hypothetical protein
MYHGMRSGAEKTRLSAFSGYGAVFPQRHARSGRCPYRDSILGRASTSAGAEYLAKSEFPHRTGLTEPARDET